VLEAAVDTFGLLYVGDSWLRRKCVWRWHQRRLYQSVTFRWHQSRCSRTTTQVGWLLSLTL